MKLPLLIAALLLAAFARPVVAAPAAYANAPCAAPMGALASRVNCGVLTADETRGSANGRRVALPVAILRAARPTGLPPVIFLHGGPGGGVIGGLPRFKPNGLFAEDQDWIFFDQRGGVLSAPGLDCGKLALNDAEPDAAQTVGALQACAARYAASGADLSRYNAVEAVYALSLHFRRLGGCPLGWNIGDTTGRTGRHVRAGMQVGE